MRTARSFVVLLAVLLAAFATLYFVLSRNLAAGVYPVEADSISIPLFEGLATVIIVLVLLGGSLFLPNRGAFRLFGLALTAGVLFIVGDAAWFWFIPKHYEVAVAYCILLAVCLVIGGKKFAKQNL